jgi:hypothetical protein
MNLEESTFLTAFIPGGLRISLSGAVEFNLISSFGARDFVFAQAGRAGCLYQLSVSLLGSKEKRNFLVFVGVCLLIVFSSLGRCEIGMKRVNKQESKSLVESHC